MANAMVLWNTSRVEPFDDNVRVCSPFLCGQASPFASRTTQQMLHFCPCQSRLDFFECSSVDSGRRQSKKNKQTRGQNCRNDKPYKPSHIHDKTSWTFTIQPRC